MGPEPDLGGEPAPPGGAGGDAAGQRDAPDHLGFLPPRDAAPHGYVPPAGASTWQGGAGQTAAGPGSHAAPWSQGPVAPDNGDAIAGLILSISAAVLLLLSAGISSIISVLCAALGIYYSRKGRARVERGETPKHHGAARAGFWTGVVTLVLSILLTIAWAAFAVLYATDEDFRQELEDELDGDGDSPDGFEAAIPFALTAVRAVALLLR